MNHARNARVMLLLIAFGVGPAVSQEKPEGLAQMEKLGLLVGTWSYTETYDKGSGMPEGSGGTGTYEARLGPGGFSLIVDFTTHTKAYDEIGHGMITWDAKEKAYKQYVVGNAFPGCVVFTGQFEDGRLTLTGEFESHGTKMGLKSVYTQWTPKATTIEEYFRTGDKPFQLLQTTKATKP